MPKSSSINSTMNFLSNFRLKFSVHKFFHPSGLKHFREKLQKPLKKAETAFQQNSNFEIKLPPGWAKMNKKTFTKKNMF